MISLSFTYDNTKHTVNTNTIYDIKEAYDTYKQQYDIPDITIHTDKYNAIITAPFIISVISTDYKIPVNHNYAVCIQSKSISTVTFNNGIYLATTTVNGDYTIDYKFNLLSELYSDVTMTIANIYNNIYDICGIFIDVTSTTSFDFKWLYDMNNIYMIYIDHNVTTCPHLFTPKYFADSFDYFDEYLVDNTEYIQSVNLKWLDDMNSGTRVSKVNPQLKSIDGFTVFTPPEKIIKHAEKEYSFIPLQGNYVHYKLVNGTPCAELNSAKYCVDNMYVDKDLVNISKEFNKNCRQEMGTRSYAYYNNKRYNTLALAYHPLFNDMYKELSHHYNSEFEDMTVIQKQEVLKAYLYVNKGYIMINRLLKEFDSLDVNTIETTVNDISNTIKAGLNTVNSFNMIDVLDNFSKLSNEFNRLHNMVKKRDDLNIDFEFWYM